LTELIREGRVAMIGPIRQELLSGIRVAGQFEQVREHLRAFPDVELEAADYEDAAAAFSRCRERGIQGSNTDFLICAIAIRRDLAIFTTDRDFEHFAPVLGLALHRSRT
jgi:predicted nucleic acid-binding protein